ncbi:CDP-glycerol glycerophosphotransferase family protein [Paenarthrobacter sp. Z7-10]|uniref:CDP-glycerol glycerophosphotransferase family protein n=1 Tax=Paenarthrobacter sp. Z7-10 TaxID=2787635 RepID=UPI0022A9608B|nr:CDP-glycerol glycerophosphotransferase family protein [Paenarthrobacter sp. Z7-10]MCZ2402946.1 CDP-glycerol glycerophosphotransferase family protein [Paenarthrobacter sp. Z7-10]
MKAKTVLFESWRGKYSDNPRAISELLATMRPDLRLIWVAGDSTELPDGVERVRRHSPEYFARLFSCSYLVSNDIVSKHMIKGPGVTYLQTWHGTPLKTIGFDEAHLTYAGAAAHQKRMVRDVSKWDYLLSPGPSSSDVLRRAFRYNGTLLESGYPRNDVLQSAEAPRIRARVRQNLGLKPDNLVVLYAPTWRDDSVGADGKYQDPQALDFELLARSVPPGTVILNRMHSVVKSAPVAAPAGFTLDVSNYPDIAELYLAADVLVSDYSSTVFDFAVTGKPIVLFAYDLALYRDKVRGLYYDYDEWAPGAIVTDTEALGAALTNLDQGHRTHAPQYQAFVQRFCPNDDGQASRRVIERVFNR